MSGWVGGWVSELVRACASERVSEWVGEFAPPTFPVDQLGQVVRRHFHVRRRADVSPLEQLGVVTHLMRRTIPCSNPK